MSEPMEDKSKRTKLKRVVIGTGSFGFDDARRAINIWRLDNKKRKVFGWQKLLSLETKRVRLIVEVLDGR